MINFIWIPIGILMVVSYCFGYYCCKLKVRNLLSRGDKLDSILDGEKKERSTEYHKGDCAKCFYMDTVNHGWVRCSKMGYMEMPCSCGKYHEREGRR